MAANTQNQQDTKPNVPNSKVGGLAIPGGGNTNSMFRRKEQIIRWEQSETNKDPGIRAEPPDTVEQGAKFVRFQPGCRFLAACYAHDTEEVAWLLSKGADINTTNVDGLTALHQVRRNTCCNF